MTPKKQNLDIMQNTKGILCQSVNLSSSKGRLCPSQKALKSRLTSTTFCLIAGTFYARREIQAHFLKKEI